MTIRGLIDWGKENKLILGILFIAFFLRTWGADFGLPDFVFHTDESYALSKARNLFAPEKRPELYITIFHIWGWILLKLIGIFKIIFNWSGGLKVTATDFLFVARIIQGVLSTASVGLTYLIGKKLFSKSFGLITAIFLAFTFVDVQTAYYFRQDTYLQFFGLLMIYCYFLNKQKLWLWMLFMGMIGSIRVTALIYTVPMFLDYFFITKKRIDVKMIELLNFGILLIIGWFLAQPDMFLGGHFNDYLGAYFNFFTKASFNWVGGDASNGVPSWLWWFRYISSTGLGYPMFAVFVVSVLAILSRLRLIFSKRHWVILFFLISVVFYYFALSVRSVRFDRHLIPITPMIAMICAYGLFIVWDYFKQFLKPSSGKFFSLIVLFLILLLPIFKVFVFVYQIGLDDTREVAYSWVEDNYSNYGPFVYVGSANIIGQILKKNGYKNMVTFFDITQYKKLESLDNGLLLITSWDYHSWENYKNVESAKEKWEAYNAIKNKYSLLKIIEPPVVSGDFFSPANLELSSTVNAYHNPVVEIYEITGDN